jgi:hypothetical protein
MPPTHTITFTDIQFLLAWQVPFPVTLAPVTNEEHIAYTYAGVGMSYGLPFC